MVGKFLKAFVDAKTDLAAELGGRFGPFPADQSWTTLPYVTYLEIDGGSLHTLSGPDGIGNRRVQLSVVAGTKADAERVAAKLAGTRGDVRLNGYRGTLGGVNVRQCFLDDQRDVALTPVHAEGRPPAEIQQDYLIYFEEAET